jgi:hypothetical protein
MSIRPQAALLLCVFAAALTSGCGANAARPVPDAKSVRSNEIWLAMVKNSTALTLLLPSTNPLRSLVEMAGKVSSDYRQSVMDLLRDSLRDELTHRGYRVALPEDVDPRFPPLPADLGAIRIAREGKISGLVFVGEIRRWEVEAQKFVRVVVDFKLLRTEDGAVLWERRVQRAVPTPSATNVGQASTDAAKIVVEELFRS